MIERHEGQLTSHQEFYKLEDSGEFFHVTEKRKNKLIEDTFHKLPV